MHGRCVRYYIQPCFTNERNFMALHKTYVLIFMQCINCTHKRLHCAVIHVFNQGHVINEYWWVQKQLHAFLTSASGISEWVVSGLGHFT
jgi:hypothetical protein